ncbi:Zinc finger MYM-type protein 6, partial [Ophiophagus hannah]
EYIKKERKSLIYDGELHDKRSCGNRIQDLGFDVLLQRRSARKTMPTVNHLDAQNTGTAFEIYVSLIWDSSQPRVSDSASGLIGKHNENLRFLRKKCQACFTEFRRQFEEAEAELNPCVEREIIILSYKQGIDFMGTVPEDMQLPQYVWCYELLSKKATKPSKLQKHLNTKHKEQATKNIIFFFKSGERKLWESKKMVKKKKTATGCNNENAVRASFEVSQPIAKTRKLCTIAEELTLLAVEIMVSALIIKRRIDGLSANIKEQLLERIHLFPYFALQLDESMDINKAILLCYIRYQHEKRVLKDILFIYLLVRYTLTAEEIVNNLNEVITSRDMNWLKSIGIRTDSAGAMSGNVTGLVAWIKEIVPSVTWYHYCIHREALAAKKIPEKPKQAFKRIIKLMYLSDIFTHLNMLDLSLQGEEITVLKCFLNPAALYGATTGLKSVPPSGGPGPNNPYTSVGFKGKTQEAPRCLEKQKGRLDFQPGPHLGLSIYSKRNKIRKMEQGDTMEMSFIERKYVDRCKGDPCETISGYQMDTTLPAFMKVYVGLVFSKLSNKILAEADLHGTGDQILIQNQSCSEGSSCDLAAPLWSPLTTPGIEVS